ncbi:MAG: PAS domain-containing protein [Methanomassiliicoccaceae archaeon]|jgi:PAS domain S-box-containing protein|nr:PAS domain-containing protein [Methanomassiliicoccaceae archaeon]
MDNKKDAGYEETLLNLILDEIDDIIVIHDSQHTIIWMNRAGLEAFGKTLDEVIGKSCYTELFGRSCPCETCTITASTLDDRCKRYRTVPRTGEHYECRTMILNGGGEIKLVVQHLKRCD